MKYIKLIFIFFVCIPCQAFQKGEDVLKKQAIEEYRLHYAKHPYRISKLRPDKKIKESKSLLQSNGRFTDLIVKENAIEKNKSYLLDVKESQDSVSDINGKAYTRLWKITETYRGKINSKNLDDEMLQSVMRSFINYGELELKRANVSGGRFHTSCFAIPLAAVNTYFAFSS